jgi:hypothetical protein
MKYDDIIEMTRAPTKHKRMERSQRAKIFMPFRALTGYENAVHHKETIYSEKRELAKERIEYMNSILISLHKGDQVKVTYFDPIKGERGLEKTLTGTLKLIDQYKQYLKIDETEIRFTDLYEIQAL